jgi:hypothetical protein
MRDSVGTSCPGFRRRYWSWLPQILELPWALLMQGTDCGVVLAALAMPTVPLVRCHIPEILCEDPAARAASAKAAAPTMSPYSTEATPRSLRRSPRSLPCTYLP